MTGNKFGVEESNVISESTHQFDIIEDQRNDFEPPENNDGTWEDEEVEEDMPVLADLA